MTRRFEVPVSSEGTRHDLPRGVSDSSVQDCLRNHKHLVKVLADRFGVERPAVLSQRDVPGLTRSAIPLLQAAGVRPSEVLYNSAISACGKGMQRGTKFEILESREFG